MDILKNVGIRFVHGGHVYKKEGKEVEYLQ